MLINALARLTPAITFTLTLTLTSFSGLSNPVQPPHPHIHMYTYKLQAALREAAASRPLSVRHGGRDLERRAAGSN